MTKSELIETLSRKMGLPKKQVEDLLNTIFDLMVQALRQGRRIEIRGFGSFSVKNHKPYTGRNPRTGQKVTVGWKKLPFFKVGKELRERVNSPITA